ncbi:hypothetical protein SAMN03159423_4921 [Bradyrhizobium sp. NFR13]|uniref:DUF6894 family protein n=1 Tax=Bradyrhizobium sp. NFR13 TaxID=1566285 RepID=UPI0008F370CB|nr:hypothetical protein [Bradyrhizobium sp. NFR13]SFM02969.1 hypothetical protein SAMN03159423_4921 [Bradyrhizobium sp. NFR13]
MTTYNFVVERAGQPFKNWEVEAANLDEAWDEATKGFGELITELDGDLRWGRDLRLLVADAIGTPVFDLRFSSTRYIGN